jgi:hypothetical protein
MALPILDGNQTAVTLATTVSGGAHFPNHIIASGTVTANAVDRNGNPFFTQATDDVALDENGAAIQAFVRLFDENLVQYSVANPLPIAGTVTVGSIPNGGLTTRFGSIATANTAFATTAVTNTSRKYLIIQNIASTVITVGIGFTPTTTQGIQLVAGATITYDGNYIPTGAVRILSSVTASNFTILEA